MKISSLLICLVLLIVSVGRFSKMNCETDYSEEILRNDTLSLYAGTTGNFVMKLNGLTEAQSISVYLDVRKGNVKLNLLDSCGCQVCRISKEAESPIEFIVPNDGDYSLRLMTEQATFTISVYINNLHDKYLKGVET